MTNNEAIIVLRVALEAVKQEHPIVAAAIDKAIDALAKDNNVLGNDWISVNEVENILAELDGFRTNNEIQYAAYSRLHDLISMLLPEPPKEET